MWPVAYSRDIVVLDRVVMDVIDVVLQIAFVADHVFPIAALPDAAFAFSPPEGRDAFVHSETTRKRSFDEHPTRSKIVALFGQCLNRMQMIRQDDPSDDLEWMVAEHIAHAFAKQIDPLDQ